MLQYLLELMLYIKTFRSVERVLERLTFSPLTPESPFKPGKPGGPCSSDVTLERR